METLNNSIEQFARGPQIPETEPATVAELSTNNESLGIKQAPLATEKNTEELKGPEFKIVNRGISVGFPLLQSIPDGDNRLAVLTDKTDGKPLPVAA